MIPLYDNTDSVCGIIYNNINYFFLKNLQGDIIAITNSDGDTVAKYSYDAWGKCSIVFDSTGYIADINPFRYRGYYLDKETNLYYLNSRYYDANTGRFINADSPEYVSIQGGNLFAYCGNCPTKNADYLGFCYTPTYNESYVSNNSGSSGAQKSTSNNMSRINIKWLGTAIDVIIFLIPALYSISKIWKTVSGTARKLAAFGDELIYYGKQLFKRFDDKLYRAFAKESTYRIVKTIGILAGIITIVSSIGSIVQYIIDILDGKWDGYLNIKQFNPKLDLTRDY